jgi:hypothetical protein
MAYDLSFAQDVESVRVPARWVRIGNIRPGSCFSWCGVARRRRC